MNYSIKENKLIEIIIAVCFFIVGYLLITVTMDYFREPTYKEIVDILKANKYEEEYRNKLEKKD